MSDDDNYVQRVYVRLPVFDSAGLQLGQMSVPAALFVTSDGVHTVSLNIEGSYPFVAGS